MASKAASAQVERQPGERLCVLEVRQARGEVGDGDAHELDRLVLFALGLALVDVLGDEDVHHLPAEAGRRPEARALAPAAAAQAGLLAQLTLRALERVLIGLERSRRKLEQLLPRRLAQL